MMFYLDEASVEFSVVRLVLFLNQAWEKRCAKYVIPALMTFISVVQSLFNIFIIVVNVLTFHHL